MRSLCLTQSGGEKLSPAEGAEQASLFSALRLLPPGVAHVSGSVKMEGQTETKPQRQTTQHLPLSSWCSV